LGRIRKKWFLNLQKKIIHTLQRFTVCIQQIFVHSDSLSLVSKSFPFFRAKVNSPQAIIVTTATTPHNSYLPHSLATARTALLAPPGNCWPPPGSSRAALLPSPAAGQQPAPRRQSRSLLKSTTQIKQRTKDGPRSGLRRPQLSSSEDRSQSRGRVSFKAPAAAEEQQQRLYTTTLVHDHNGAVVVTTTTAATAAQLRLSRPLGRHQRPAWSFEAAERSAAERRRRQGAFAGLRSRSEDTTTQTTTPPTALYSVQGKEYIY
jgi:hypothetical protein